MSFLYLPFGAAKPATVLLYYYMVFACPKKKQMIKKVIKITDTAMELWAFIH